MKKQKIILIVTLLLLWTVSCNDPETIITNYIHPDGSVTRKIEMRSGESDIQKRFRISEIQVPVDSTWNFRDSCEILKEDTIWVRRGEKLFGNVGEINLSYKADSGSNKSSFRSAEFKKSFRWFNTVYNFSEKIEKRMSFGHPVKGFLNNEELMYFYTPDGVKESNLKGADSLRFKALDDSIKYKTDKWTAKNLASEWIGEFSKLVRERSDSTIVLQTIKSHEDDLAEIVFKDDKKLDSLWKNGIILTNLIGEPNARLFKSEADSALSIVSNKLLASFSDYSERIVMPGKLIGTNGFIDSTRLLIWPVKSDFFISEQYEMWAKSKTSNRWAWIVSGIFLVSVLTGIIIRIIKKD